MHQCGRKWRRRQPDVRIVGESKPFFWDSDEVPVEPGVAVFVVNRSDRIVAWRHVLPHRSRLALAGRNGCRSVAERLAVVLRPAVGGLEDGRTYDAVRIAQSIDVN